MTISVRSFDRYSNNGATDFIDTDADTPTGMTVGDLAIAFVFRNYGTSGSDGIHDDNGSTPFTRDREDVDPTSGTYMSIWTRRIQVGDPNVWRWVYNPRGSDSWMSILLVALQNPDPTTIYDVAPGSGTNTITASDSGSASGVSITTTVAGSIHFLTSVRENSGYTGIPAGYTELNPSGSTFYTRSCYKVIADPGSTGAQTFTGASSVSSVIQSFAIKNSSITVDPNAYTVTRKVVYATQ